MRKILYIIPLILFSFTFTGGPPQGWYQQSMPFLNNEPISDIIFLDSLTGFAVTGDGSPNDTNFILKTTNGGDNWVIKFSAYRDFFKIHFINNTTGFACGGFNVVGGGLFKTTDGGESWNPLNSPSSIEFRDMSILSNDTLWLVGSSAIDGGVFHTTNGGSNWTQQLNLGSQNPSKIYMYDANTGYISNSSTSYLRKTTNGGINWDVVSGATGFTDIQFLDANTGWKARGGTNIQRTTDGGQNWTIQELTPKGPNIVFSRVSELSILNKDTIWGFGRSEYITQGNQIRGMIHLTTDGGKTWGFQLPDTNILIPSYRQGIFVNKFNGWAYANTPTGVHTVTGGNDTTIYLSIQTLSSEIPESFKLHQNYPNPFNPVTNIVYDIKIKSEVKLTIYDISGKQINRLVNQTQQPGTYKYTFDGSGLPSGIYLYRLQTESFTETKKMTLVK